MKRFHLPGFVDILKVDDASAINQLIDNSNIDRQFSRQKFRLNRWLLTGTLNLLSYKGSLFPTMRAFSAPGRALAQHALWERLNRLAPQMRAGPAELEPLALWVSGIGRNDALGPMVQQMIGQLFNPDFVATSASWSAALSISAAATPGRPLQKLWWSITGRPMRAKSLLASMLGGDLAAMHGTAIAIHNVVKGLRDMRALHTRSKTAIVSGLSSPGDVVRQCLHAPSVVLRQPMAAGSINNCPYSRHTLILMELGKAYRRDGDMSMVFLGRSWSRCPAEQWVPAIMEGVWRRTQLVQ